MEVEIQEVVSTVRAVDGDALLAPQTLKRILTAVMQAIGERDAHERRVRAEQRVSDGVRAELEEDRR